MEQYGFNNLYQTYREVSVVHVHVCVCVRM